MKVELNIIMHSPNDIAALVQAFTSFSLTCNLGKHNLRCHKSNLVILVVTPLVQAFTF